MNDDYFAARGRALEESVFQRKNQELLAQLRNKLNQQQVKADLTALLGIHNEALLDQLLALNIGPEMIVAMTMVPLVVVAWADGSIGEKERAAVLAAAELAGVKPGAPGGKLLNSWLDEQPGEKLLNTWEQYVAALSQTLEPQAKATLKSDILERAKQVAKSAGGILGLHKISASEQAMLARLEKAFG